MARGGRVVVIVYAKAVAGDGEDSCFAAIERAAQTVRYHDLHDLAGMHGIAVTRTCGAGYASVAFVLQRPHEARVAFDGDYDPALPMEAVLRRILGRAPVGSRGDAEIRSLRKVLPGPGDRPLSHEHALGDGNTHQAHLDAQRAQARAVLSTADLPAAMRRALHSVLDHGLPDDAGGIVGQRENARRCEGGGTDPLWDTLGLMATDPALVPLLLDRGALASHVRHGHPLREALALHYPDLTARHLAAVRAAHRAGFRPLVRIPDRHRTSVVDGPGPQSSLMLLALSGLPPEWVPRDEPGWRAFTDLAYATSEYMAWTGSEAGELLRASRGDWPAYLDRCLAAADVCNPHSRTPCEILRVAGRDLDDVADALAQAVTLPAMAHSLRDAGIDLDPRNPKGERSPKDMAEEAARRLLYAGKGIPAGLDLSNRWHGISTRLDAAVRTAGTRLDWPPLFPSPVRVGDVEIVPVADSVALAQEGSPSTDGEGVLGMGHCVASRMPLVASGEAHVLSLRRVLPGGGYERLSTAQVRVERRPGRLALLVDEHRGRHNGTVPREADVALGALAIRVRDGTQPVVEEALARKPGRVSAGEIANVCGYDWTRPEAVANAIAAWAPLLPRWTRGMGAGEFMSAMLERGYLAPEWRAEVGWS